MDIESTMWLQNNEGCTSNTSVITIEWRVVSCPAYRHILFSGFALFETCGYI